VVSLVSIERAFDSEVAYARFGLGRVVVASEFAVHDLLVELLVHLHLVDYYLGLLQLSLSLSMHPPLMSSVIRVRIELGLSRQAVEVARLLVRGVEVRLVLVGEGWCIHTVALIVLSLHDD
jgi:hypothetical protein